MDHLCYLCLVFAMLSRLFIAALWSPAWKGVTSWLLFVMLTCILSLSLVVSWVRCGASLYRLLIFAAFFTLLELRNVIYHMKSRLGVILQFLIFIAYNSQWLNSMIYWLINYCTDWARTGVAPFCRQFDVFETIYHIQT